MVGSWGSVFWDWPKAHKDARRGFLANEPTAVALILRVSGLFSDFCMISRWLRFFYFLRSLFGLNASTASCPGSSMEEAVSGFGRGRRLFWVSS